MRLINADDLAGKINKNIEALGKLTPGKVYATVFATIYAEPTVAFTGPQRPRVMTLEEVKALPEQAGNAVPVILEQRFPYGAWDGGSFCRWRGSDYVHEEYLVNDELFSEDNYNEVWRCWTYQPTGEQMEAVPWQS